MVEIFKRKVTEKLVEWKEKYSDGYACLLEGPRRVGKSTIAEEFAKTYYESYILINFANLSDELNDVLKHINDLDYFFMYLQAVSKVTLIPHKSLIIFDEIQLAPKVRQAIKFLVKDGRYNYIETGSLISIKKNIKDIVLPSEEYKIQVHPMDYEEFCWATKKNYELLVTIENFNKPLGQALNRELSKDFRTYIAVGGMPQAVDAYIKKESFEKIDLVKRQIIDLYKDDFKKIDPSGKVSMIFESIPSQLAMSKKRFVLSRAIDKSKIFDKDENALYELLDSKTVLACYDVNDPSISLSSNYDVNSFKLYYSDVGLFVTQIFNNKELLGEDIYIKILKGDLNANLGYVYENAIAQIIASTNKKLFYHTWKSNKNSHSYEIDFLIADKTKLIPIEVKSSDKRNHQSINEFSKKYSSRISRRILFSQSDIGNDGMLELKPLYLAPLIISKIK